MNTILISPLLLSVPLAHVSTVQLPLLLFPVDKMEGFDGCPEDGTCGAGVWDLSALPMLVLPRLDKAKIDLSPIGESCQMSSSLLRSEKQLTQSILYYYIAQCNDFCFIIKPSSASVYYYVAFGWNNNPSDIVMIAPLVPPLQLQDQPPISAGLSDGYRARLFLHRCLPIQG